MWPGQLLTSFRRGKTCFFLLCISMAILWRFCHLTDNITGKKMSQKEEEKTGILFVEVQGMWGHNSRGGGAV